MILLYALGLLVGLIIIYLVIIIFLPGINVQKQPLSQGKLTRSNEQENAPSSRTDISFKVNGSEIKGWFYLPENRSSPLPCIILNNGFGGTKDVVLEQYALRFQKAGMAALTYDYRHFGESDGEPRQLFSIQSQLKDCRAAIDFARLRSEVNPDKIGIWGTSASGGYGLAIAAEDKQIACISAQVAGLDSKEDGKLFLQREGWGFILRLLMHAQRDKGRSRFGLSPHKIPIVGKKGTMAMFPLATAYDGYTDLTKNSGFINEVCARVLLTTGNYNPVNFAKDVNCPVLIQVCEQDVMVSPKSADKIKKMMDDKAEIIHYPVGHFDIYKGDHFEKAVSDQISFFKKHLV
jgi:fermentation-respiration switch protein FrsA (DUF1100 family)